MITSCDTTSSMFKLTEIHESFTASSFTPLSLHIGVGDGCLPSPEEICKLPAPQIVQCDCDLSYSTHYTVVESEAIIPSTSHLYVPHPLPITLLPPFPALTCLKIKTNQPLSPRLVADFLRGSPALLAVTLRQTDPFRDPTQEVDNAHIQDVVLSKLKELSILDYDTMFISTLLRSLKFDSSVSVTLHFADCNPRSSTLTLSATPLPLILNTIRKARIEQAVYLWNDDDNGDEVSRSLPEFTVSLSSADPKVELEWKWKLDSGAIPRLTDLGLEVFALRFLQELEVGLEYVEPDQDEWRQVLERMRGLTHLHIEMIDVARKEEQMRFVDVLKALCPPQCMVTSKFIVENS